MVLRGRHPKACSLSLVQAFSVHGLAQAAHHHNQDELKLILSGSEVETTSLLPVDCVIDALQNNQDELTLIL